MCPLCSKLARVGLFLILILFIFLLIFFLLNGCTTTCKTSEVPSIPKPSIPQCCVQLENQLNSLKAEVELLKRKLKDLEVNATACVSHSIKAEKYAKEAEKSAKKAKEFAEQAERIFETLIGK